jgi:ligand-binding sensor domain-containing protein/signal transduction histidine kinase
LARNTIDCIVQDARGFLWFCTSEGLSRFDGYSFTNYGTEHGLPHRVATSLLVSRGGVYWVGSSEGLFRFDPNSIPPQRFEAVPLGAGSHAPRIYSLIEDRSGSLWVGTNAGLYRLEPGKAAWNAIDAGIPVSPDGRQEVLALLEDRAGMLWIASVGSVHVRTPDGLTRHYQDRRVAHEPVMALCEDREGRIWASDYSALYRLNPNAGPRDPIVARTYTVKDGLPGNRIEALLASSGGRFWVGGFGGMAEYVPAADKFESYTVAQGLSDQDIYSLAEDREGNLWVGTASAGVMKIARRGFTSYTPADGLSDVRVASIFVDQAGNLCVWRVHTGAIDCFNGKRFTSMSPKYPPEIHSFGWGWNQTAFQDHTGEWWVPTAQGLCRFARTTRAEQLAGRVPKAVYTTRDGLPGNEIFRLFEDSRGDIWIVDIGREESITRWERATASFHVYTAADGLSKIPEAPTAFAEDRSGQLWMGFYDGGLARFKDGRFNGFSEGSVASAGMIRALHVDRAGRLWIASNHGGLGRIDDPGEVSPRLSVYTTADGLSNNSVLCLTEDEWGRIYACTGRGVDRLDPATGRIKHYTTADGLVRGELNAAGRDRQSALWFGSLQGLSRLVPEPDPQVFSPPVFIMGLQVRGVSWPLPEIGQSTVSRLLLQPDQNQLRLDFIGLGFAPGERLRYQYRLEGADRDWSPPTEQRTVNYANLRPGRYAFHVRALNVEGAASRQPALVAFTVLAPTWQRWWFLSAAGCALGLLIYALYRYRLAQLLALERIRARIATDLHDDIGSSLTQVAILSEVVRRRLGESDPEINAPLSRIGTISRELVDSMSDIVWSINPAKDKLYFLTQRMREFAGDLFMARGVQFEFRASSHEQDLGIGADVRRQVFLIFKECVHNVIRHANCTYVEIDVRREGERLAVQVRDNGPGFEPYAAMNGHGLASMRERAQRLGGGIEVAADAHGTAVTLKVPLLQTASHHLNG